MSPEPVHAEVPAQAPTPAPRPPEPSDIAEDVRVRMAALVERLSAPMPERAVS